MTGRTHLKTVRLSTDSRDWEDHGRLPSYADCHECSRTRLSEILWGGLVSRRTHAAIVASLLAVSAAPPVGALATQPDPGGGSTTAVEQGVNGDPTTGPDFDPGDDSTEPASVPAAAPTGVLPDDSDDVTAVPDPEAPDDLEPPPLADSTGVPQDATAQRQPTASTPAGQTDDAPPSTEPAVATGPRATAGATSDRTSDPTAPSPDGDGDAPKPAGEPRSTEKTTPPRAPVVAPAPRGGAIATASAAGQSPRAQQAPIVAATSAAGASVRPGDRAHIVHAGESLWSIATDLLGDRAPAARISREVTRLWELNEDRIGTGDRDLLMIGTRLRLR